MSDSGEFSVYQFFPSGSYERVISFVGPETAVRIAAQLTRSVGARTGTTVRIIITDGSDNTAFEWRLWEGVTFPPLAEPQQERPE